MQSNVVGSSLPASGGRRGGGMRICARRPVDWTGALALYRSEGFVAAEEVGDKIRLRWTHGWAGEKSESTLASSVRHP